MNKTNFPVKGFALGLALKQRRKATRKRAMTHRKVTDHQPTRSVFPTPTRLINRHRGMLSTSVQIKSKSKEGRLVAKAL